MKLWNVSISKMGAMISTCQESWEGCRQHVSPQQQVVQHIETLLLMRVRPSNPALAPTPTMVTKRSTADSSCSKCRYHEGRCSERHRLG